MRKWQKCPNLLLSVVTSPQWYLLPISHNLPPCQLPQKNHGILTLPCHPDHCWTAHLRVYFGTSHWIRLQCRVHVKKYGQRGSRFLSTSAHHYGLCYPLEHRLHRPRQYGSLSVHPCQCHWHQTNSHPIKDKRRHQNLPPLTQLWQGPQAETPWDIWKPLHLCSKNPHRRIG